MMLADMGATVIKVEAHRGRLLPRAARLLRLESRQALDRHEPEGSRRPRDRSPARRGRRRGDGEHAPRRGRAPRRRLRDAPRAQSAAHLLVRDGLRPRWPLSRPPGLRSAAAGDGRRHGGPGLRRPAPVLAHRAHRLLHGGARLPGDPGRALRARAHGQGTARRDVAAPGRDRAAGRHLRRLPGRGRRSIARRRPTACTRRGTASGSSWRAATSRSGPSSARRSAARTSPTIRASAPGSRGGTMPTRSRRCSRRRFSPSRATSGSASWPTTTSPPPAPRRSATSCATPRCSTTRWP